MARDSRAASPSVSMRNHVFGGASHTNCIIRSCEWPRSDDVGFRTAGPSPARLRHKRRATQLRPRLGAPATPAPALSMPEMPQGRAAADLMNEILVLVEKGTHIVPARQQRDGAIARPIYEAPDLSVFRRLPFQNLDDPDGSLHDRVLTERPRGRYALPRCARCG